MVPAEHGWCRNHMWSSAYVQLTSSNIEHVYNCIHRVRQGQVLNCGGSQPSATLRIELAADRAAASPEPAHRVVGGAIDSGFVVQVRAGGPPGAADPADAVARVDLLAVIDVHR